MSDGVVITVQGSHSAEVEPDFADLALRVRVEAADRATAADRLAAVAEGVRARLAALEGRAGFVRWASQRVGAGSYRPWADGRELEPVHFVEQGFSARFAAAELLGGLVDALAAIPEVAVDSVGWGLLPETYRRVEQEVAAAAIRVAVDRAQAYAAALGLAGVVAEQIADVGLLEEAARSPRAKAVRLAAVAADAGGTPGLDLLPAPQTVAAAVEARFLAR